MCGEDNNPSSSRLISNSNGMNSAITATKENSRGVFMAEAEAEALVKRFRDLEASQARLREQLSMLIRRGGGGGGGAGGDGGSEPWRRTMARWRTEDRGLIRGFFAGSPYGKVLQHMGHALHVCRPTTGEIIYWNQPAENLFGWKEYEVLGRRASDVLKDDQSHAFLNKIMDRLCSGQSWSGQLPLKKKSGDMFMALVTKSPLYENGEFIGVITVSSDAEMFNEMNSDRARTYMDQANVQPREGNADVKRVQWRSPQPQIVSSVSNLASKVFTRGPANHDSEGGNFHGRCDCPLEKKKLESEEIEISASEPIFKLHGGRNAVEEKGYKFDENVSKTTQRSNMAAKVFSKFRIRGNANHEETQRGAQGNSAKFLARNFIKRITEITESNSPGSHGGTNGDKEGIYNLPADSSLQLVLTSNQ